MVLNHEDVLSLVVPSVESEGFNPEQSVVYRFHNLAAPSKAVLGPKLFAQQKNSPNKPNNRMFLSSEEMSIHNVASKPSLISAEHSAPEDFVRVIKVRKKPKNISIQLTFGDEKQVNASDEVLSLLHAALKVRIL